MTEISGQLNPIHTEVRQVDEDEPPVDDFRTKRGSRFR